MKLIAKNLKLPQLRTELACKPMPQSHGAKINTRNAFCWYQTPFSIQTE